jgi:hypothetical protein
MSLVGGACASSYCVLVGAPRARHERGHLAALSPQMPLILTSSSSSRSRRAAPCQPSLAGAAGRSSASQRVIASHCHWRSVATDRSRRSACFCTDGEAPRAALSFDPAVFEPVRFAGGAAADAAGISRCCRWVQPPSGSVPLVPPPARVIVASLETSSRSTVTGPFAKVVTRRRPTAKKRQKSNAASAERHERSAALLRCVRRRVKRPVSAYLIEALA